jgi:hypothetical protein
MKTVVKKEGLNISRALIEVERVPVGAEISFLRRDHTLLSAIVGPMNKSCTGVILDITAPDKKYCGIMPREQKVEISSTCGADVSSFFRKTS